MSDLSITISGTKRLLTKGKLCDKNIVVTAEGGDDRYAEGVEDGKQAQYDAFWDTYQQNGNRNDYSYAFAGNGWTDETFKPKYDIVPTGIIDRLFSGSGITDLVKLLADANCTLDISAVRAVSYVALSAKTLQTLPVLNTQNIADMSYFINTCDVLHTIEKVILKSDGTQTFSNYSFGSLPKLVNIAFEGVIGKNFIMKNSPLLSSASVQSIIDCLKDLTGATAQTLTFHSDVNGRMTEQQILEVYNKNWTLG